MKFSRIRSYALVGVAGLLLDGSSSRAMSAAPNKHKVIIYPSAGETIGQMRQQGITNVANYGSYWLAETDDKHFKALQATHGERAVSGSYLNYIELQTTRIDTSVGEPAVSAGMRQEETAGKHLRLIQFKGPVKSSWLNQVKAVGDVRIVSYIPNNAYILWLDSNAEQKLASLMGPQGPIQWMGAYHPYYKISRSLLSPSGTESIKVRVAVVDQAQDPQATASAVSTLGLVITSLVRDGQEIFEMDVPPSAIARIAQLPDVLWIEKVSPKRILDEVQGLVVLDQTNQLPNFSPIPRISGGTNYLDFLLSAVGGGMSEFIDPLNYPVVDIADTGLDNGTIRPFHPAFYFLGQTNLGSRIVNLLPPWLAGNPVPQFGCTTRITDNAGAGFRPLETADLDGHGTMVASILTGYDTGTNIDARQTLVLALSSNTVDVLIPGSSFPGNISNCSDISGASSNVTLQIPSGVTNICGDATFTNVTFTVTTNGCPLGTNAVIAFIRVDTNFVSETRTDANGFQFGMGISPFGLISVNRLWGTMESSVFGVVTRNNACLADYHATGICMNDFITLMSEAYAFSFARIQNNSWADDISTTGDNGGIYTTDCITFDLGVRDAVRSATNSITPLNQEFIVVFACNSLLSDAGNQGNTGGFADMRVTSPATAKNVISVGSSVNPTECASGGSSQEMYVLSAVGPTVDGRFKPEIVAPGAGVVAAFDQLAEGILIAETGLTSTNCTVDNLVPFAPFITNSISPSCTDSQIVYTALYVCGIGGSSFAAPAISGGIQLLWWYFQHRLTNEVGRALEQPSPAMAKAYVCNAAHYLSVINPATGAKDTLPSSLQGMGELDMGRMFDGVGRVIRDESSPRAIDVPLTSTNRVPQQTFFSQSGQSYELSGQIQSNGLPFRVTLAWVDAAGTPAALQQLVNDLDLEVTVGGQKYKGNEFSEDHSIPGGTFDKVNNLESVFLPPGQTGTWSVIVRAVNIAGRSVQNVGDGFNQDFALVVYNSTTNISVLTDVPHLETNNACHTALPITSFPFVFTNGLNKTHYNNTHPSPTAGRGGVDEFFKMETPDVGITFSVDTSGSSFNTVLSVWRVATIPQTLQGRGECGALEEVVSTEIESTNGGGGAQSPLTFTSDGSNTYFIVVEPQNNGDGGTMVLNVNATGTGIVLSPSALNFGDQILGTTSTPQTVSYQRVTGAGVTINSVSIGGSDTADFQISAETCVDRTLIAGGSCAVTIDFTPQAIGLRQATLVINDTGTGSPRLIPLSGTGTPPAPLICLGKPPGALTFTNTAVGVSSAPQTITITNCGTAALVVSNVIFRTKATNDYSVVQSCTNAPIAPGGTCSLAITFKPTISGARSTILDITNNSSISPVEVAVTGTGFIPAPAVCASGASEDFGSVAVGGTGSVQSVTITNCGTATLTNINATLTGANTGDFIIVMNACGTNTVTTGTTCQVSLQFAPSAGGARSANLAFSDNAPGSPQLVSLTGSGSLSQPDAAVGKNTKLKKMVGFGTNNVTGIGQEIIRKIPRRKIVEGKRLPRGVRSFIAVRNVGSASDSFLVQGDASSGGFTVTYFLGSKPADSIDVSAAVEAGTFSTATMGPGAVTGDATMIRVEVFADRALVAPGTTKTFTLTFTSAGDPTKQDAVRVTVIAR